MAKVLVLGGSGFLGSSVTAAFRARGYAVETHSRRNGLDARDEDAVSACLRRSNPDILVHAAAHVGGIAYNAKCPVAIFEDNLQMGFAVVRAARRAGIPKLVNVMPNCTYPGEMELYAESRWWDGPMHPTVVTYGMPRKALWAHAWACQMEQQLASIHLVLPNLYGPRDHFDAVRSHALGALVRKIVDAKHNGIGQIDVWGTGNAVREWMYVEDAAEGIVMAAERYDEIEILNLGSGKGCSIRELAEMIAAAAGWRGQLVFDRARPDGAPIKILDTRKMTEKLGAWFPATRLADGIARTVGWYEEHRETILAAAPAVPASASR
jgi:GDP-L-fucose synthase